VVKDFPDIKVNKVGFRANRDLAMEAGVKSIPALVYGDRKLSGLLLTKAKIRHFLEQI